MSKILYIIILFTGIMIAFSCNKEEEPNLPSYEERVETVISELKGELTIPENGWRLEYKPTPESGTYLVLLQFNEDGTVHIQSDLSSNDGEFYDQTITYRIDNALSTELILESYAFFHFLFEQDQATFGAEFEFVFVEKQGENLVFESKSDAGAKSSLVFQPASSSDKNAFARELSENLDKFQGIGPSVMNVFAPVQQLYIENRDVSIFWSMDPIKRNISVDLAGVGSTVDEIFENEIGIFIFHETGYFLTNDKLVLNSALTFQLNGQSYEIKEIELTEFSMTGPSFCAIDPESTPRYDGQIPSLGPVYLQSSLFSSAGMGFQSNSVYTVNVFFVADSAGNSLSEEGIIADNYPDASGFAFLYGAELTNPDLPIYSTGIITDTGLALRSFDSTETVGNKVDINLGNEYYISDSTATIEDTLKLNEFTDELYYGNEIYAFEYPIEGLVVYWLYNPCNKYEFLLVQ